jgi:polar amino acid transport system substrate-binding protein
MKRFIVVITLLVMSLSAAAVARADDLANILSVGVVRIGVPVDVPPFGSLDANRNPVDLDIELAQMIGKSLGVKVELQEITGANRIPYLLTHKIDIVIAALGMTPERAKLITYTNPYADTYDAVYGPKSVHVTSAAELGNLKVVLNKGTTQDTELTGMNANANIMRTQDDANDATAATAYMSGQADLFATNSLVVQELVKQNPGKEFDRKFVLARGPAHMGVRMGEQNLCNWLNVFLYSIALSGDLDKLTQKYLGHPYEQLPAL